MADAEAVALAAAQEINQLRDRVAELTVHSVALNAACWAMAEALGLLAPGQKSIEMAPLELVRRLIAQRDAALEKSNGSS